MKYAPPYSDSFIILSVYYKGSISLQELIGSFVKAKLEIGKPAVKTISCVFNPSSYSMTNRAMYREKNKMGNSVIPQFTGIAPMELNVTLIFDSSSLMQLAANTVMQSAASGKAKEPQPVSVYTNELMKLVMVKPDEHQPPVVTFCWGNLEFTGHVKSLEHTYTMFSINGKPIRASVKLVIMREEDGYKTPLESPDRTKYTTFTEGMSLWMLAHKEYGDCEKWRVIAKANGIENPLDLKPGQMLKIPAL